MTKKTEDLRFKKTEKAIRDSFFELLRSKKISEITVAEISRTALLGRGTFYLHYRDIYDLLNTLENEYIEEIGKILDEYLPLPPADKVSEMTSKIFLYIHKNQDHFRLLFNHISPRHFVDRLIIRQKDNIETLAKEKGLAEDEVYSTVKTSFMISGFAGVVLDYWFRGSEEWNEKDIINRLNRIILAFVTSDSKSKEDLS